MSSACTQSRRFGPTKNVWGISERNITLKTNLSTSQSWKMPSWSEIPSAFIDRLISTTKTSLDCYSSRQWKCGILTSTSNWFTQYNIIWFFTTILEVVIGLGVTTFITVMKNFKGGNFLWCYVLGCSNNYELYFQHLLTVDRIRIKTVNLDTQVFSACLLWPPG